MEALLAFLFSERGLALLAWIGGLVWAAIKRKQWARDEANRNYMRALECVRNAVAVTYETYVHEIKAARADGKLTEAERAEARKRAQQAAIEFGLNDGLDVVKTIGKDVYSAIVDRTVREAKRSERVPASLKTFLETGTITPRAVS